MTAPGQEVDGVTRAGGRWRGAPRSSFPRVPRPRTTRCGSSRCARRIATSGGRRTASARSSRSPWPWSSAPAPPGVAVFGLAATATVAYLSEDLPDPSQLESLTFAQPTILYDRDGEVELGRFQTVERRVVAYDDVPRLVLDATTTRRTARSGRTPASTRRRSCPRSPRTRAGKASAAHRRSPSSWSARGCSPTDVVAPGSDRYIRKAKEILQSMRLNETYPAWPARNGSSRRTSTRSTTGTRRTGSPPRQGLLRGRGPRQPDAGPGGAARLAAQVAEHPRSVFVRRGEQGRRPGRAP